jgi:hypothetical protein
MLSGLLAKITGSLGKSFIFAGLLPAAILIAVVSSYWIGIRATWALVPGITSSIQDVKQLSLIGIIWVSLGFILFAIRTWIFSRFQIMPTGRIGVAVLNYQLNRRERFRRERENLEWQYTAVCWYEEKFAAEATANRPNWIELPQTQATLTNSHNALERLNSVIQRSSSGLHLLADDHCILRRGLIDLYTIVTDKTAYEHHKDQFDAMLADWRTATSHRAGKSVLRLVADGIVRELTPVHIKLHRYPEGAWIYPTTIGNHLAALDDYAKKRYGIDTAIAWERLWWVLPSSAKSDVSDARLTVETLVNLMAVLLLAAFGVLAVAAARHVSPQWVQNAGGGTLRDAAFFIGSAILAIISYRGAVFAMEALTSKITTLIDMNRFSLLAAMGYRPETVAEEQEMFAELHGFLAGAGPRKLDRKLSTPKSGGSSEDKDGKENNNKKNGTKKQKETEKEDDDGGESTASEKKPVLVEEPDG